MWVRMIPRENYNAEIAKAANTTVSAPNSADNRARPLGMFANRSSPQRARL